MMKVLLDTSVLISAMLPDHVHHSHSRSLLERVKSPELEGFVSAHSLAESYAVLTKLPRTPRITPTEAFRLIQENVTSHVALVALSADGYVKLISDLASASIVGGTVYDAIIARAAELAGVDRLVTLNVDHFRHVWPSGSGRIVSPEEIAVASD